MRKKIRKYIINFSGEKEPFSARKVYRSARRVGASEELAEKIAKTIEREAYPGIKSSEIFKKVKKLLQQKTPKAALKFNLKEGMKKLGPTGFPFEKYIGAIFLKNDFEVKLNQHISGLCCKYEIDFLAKKRNLIYIGECKYRNLPGAKVHSDIALANYARFLDIKKGKFFRKNNYKNLKIKSLLITNTKFTTKTIKYSNCMGIELFGWNYPRNKGLEYLIDSQRLYPITILPSLSSSIAEIFASNRLQPTRGAFQEGGGGVGVRPPAKAGPMMLAQDILKVDIKKFAKKTKISEKRLKQLLKEAKILLEQD